MEKENDSSLIFDRLTFEDLKKVNQYGMEYWSARDLQDHLGYSKWQSFENAIRKAVESCKQSGNDPSYHFTGARKLIIKGKGASQEVDDHHLSRFACYLIAQNGDPRKLEIAQAQKYFAVQTRRQELSDAAIADLERLELRKQTSQDFKALSGAAKEAGVQSKMFGIFHDAGYKGLYGGLGSDAIKARKGIDPKEQLMDRMDRTELAANQFRMTQTREKLKRENLTSSSSFRERRMSISSKIRLLEDLKSGSMELEFFLQTFLPYMKKKGLKLGTSFLSISFKNSSCSVNISGRSFQPTRSMLPLQTS